MTVVPKDDFRAKSQSELFTDVDLFISNTPVPIIENMTETTGFDLPKGTVVGINAAGNLIPYTRATFDADATGAFGVLSHDYTSATDTHLSVYTQGHFNVYALVWAADHQATLDADWSASKVYVYNSQGSGNLRFDRNEFAVGQTFTYL